MSPSLKGAVGPSHGCCPLRAGNDSSWGGCCWAQNLFVFVWAPAASPDGLTCTGQARTRLDAKFKASEKDGVGQEGTFPAGGWGLALFEELLQFRWLMECQLPVLLCGKVCSGSAVSQYVSFLLFPSRPALSSTDIEMDTTHSMPPTVRKTS